MYTLHYVMVIKTADTSPGRKLTSCHGLGWNEKIPKSELFGETKTFHDVNN